MSHKYTKTIIIVHQGNFIDYIPRTCVTKKITNDTVCRYLYLNIKIFRMPFVFLGTPNYKNIELLVILSDPVVINEIFFTDRVKKILKDQIDL